MLMGRHAWNADKISGFPLPSRAVMNVISVPFQDQDLFLRDVQDHLIRTVEMVEKADVDEREGVGRHVALPGTRLEEAEEITFDVENGPVVGKEYLPAWQPN